MHNNIAIELLKTLSKQELKKFELFLKSPYHNTNKSVLLLFNVIKKFAPDYTDETLYREKLFKKIYPNKEYNELSLRTRMSELAELVRSFITQLHFESNDFLKKISLAESLRLRYKNKLSEKYLNELIDENDNSKDTSVQVYHNRIRLFHEMLYLKKDDTAASPEYLTQLGDAVINYFLSYFFKIVNNIYFYEDMYKYKPEFDIVKIFLDDFNVQDFLDRLQKADYEKYPFIAINYYMYMTRIDKDNDVYFYKLKELALKYHSKFDIIGQTNLWGYLGNAITINLQFKDKKYMKELFEINKFFLELNIMPYREGDYFVQFLFDGVVIAALQCNELDYADNFIKNYGKHLHPDNRENNISMFNAMTSFYRKDYESSLNCLSKVHLKDSFIKIRTRLLYFMNYFETNSFESGLSLLDSIKHFFSENKNMTEFLSMGLDVTVKYMSKLLNAKMNNKKLDYAVYAEAKSTEGYYVNREWILDKMEELI
jgi:hypothetical protein